MKKTEDAAKETVTVSDLRFITDITLIIFILWMLGTIWDNFNLKSIIKSLPEVLGNLASIMTCLLAVIAVKNGLLNKGGNKYYPNQFGEEKLANIVDQYNDYDNYSTVLARIFQDLNNENREESSYFKCVFILQKTNDDFVKVWNDYNFLSVKKNRTEKEEKYYKKLEKYVFINVFEELEKHPEFA